MLRVFNSLRFALLKLIKPFILVDFTHTRRLHRSESSASDDNNDDNNSDDNDNNNNDNEQLHQDTVNNTTSNTDDKSLTPEFSKKTPKNAELLQFERADSGAHQPGKERTYSKSRRKQKAKLGKNNADQALKRSESAGQNSLAENDLEDGDMNGEPKKVRFNGNGALSNENGVDSLDKKDKENKILRSQLEKALRSIQLLEFQLNERNSMTENLKEAEDAHAQIFEKDLNAKEHELSESKSQLADAKNKISQLNKENDTKSKTIEELHKRISDAFEASMSENYVKENGTHTSADQDKIFKFEADILRLEQRLKDVTEEKEYYKKHHQANVNNNNQVPNGGASNGGNLNDEFGRELMLANKRKYQLENRMKQLEYELKEAHSAQQTMERNLKNTEKLLWLEKERSATLESELHLLRRDLEEQRRLNDELNAELDRYHLRDEAETLNTTAVLMPNTALRKEGGGEQFVKEMENLQKDYDIKLTDLIQLKNKAEWRLGEMTQNWHDAKWRVGELEATISHKNSEIEQLSNRVKQLESVLATPVTNMGEELQRLRSEIVQISEEKNKVEWRLGEVTQFWNDAKWRVGELEGEVCQNRCRLEDAHRRISQLESWSNAGEIDSLRNEKNNLECRLGEITQALNDSKWRIGELEAELHKQLSIQGQSEAVQKLGNEIQLLRKCLDETREQKSKVEWRLGEVTQYWNDTKWRTGELQELINHKDQEIIHLKNMTNVEQKSCARNVSSKLNGTFILKKQPHADRHKWNNMILWENTVEKDVQMRRVWFEVDVADESQDVFLIGSFVNWECAIRCETLADNAKRSGVWLELPPGHHEFRFIRGGNWHTAANYGQWHNEFGDLNNWRHVD